MARKNSELEALRAEVRKRHVAASRKISRLRAKGVEIGGTGFDVRRDPSNIRGYTRKQLESYRAQLEGFTSRASSFVPGESGTPIPAALWREYKAIEATYNHKVKAVDDAVGGIHLPNANMTIAERDATFRPNERRKQASNEGMVRKLFPINRLSTHVNGAAAVRTLMQQLVKKMFDGYIPAEIKKSRKEMDHMLDVLGASDMKKKAHDLSDEQFHVLWEYSNFANGLASLYDIIQKRISGTEERWYSKNFEDNRVEVRDMLKWAKGLEINGPAGNTPQRQKITPAPKGKRKKG